MTEVLLLPSARLVPAELQSEFGRIPSAMIPLNNRPALHYIVSQHSSSAKALIAVHERAELLHEYLAQHPDLSVFAVDVGETPHIAATVLEALKSFDEPISSLAINFADTLVCDTLAGADVVCWALPPEQFRWTTFALDRNGRIGEIYEKNEVKPHGADRVFVGVFRISNATQFVADLEEAVRSPSHLDPFWVAIRQYYNRAAGVVLHEVSDWRDFGHLDTYFATKRQFANNTRHFNALDVDARRGIVRKYSTERAKLHNEVRWYTGLPAQLQYLAPRVFAEDMSAQKPWVDIEFYGYPALSDLYLYGDLNIGVWQQILAAIGAVLDDMQQSAEPSDDPTRHQAALHDMYATKTRSRLGSVIKDERFAIFCRDRIQINGEECLGIPSVLDLLPELIRASELDRVDRFTVIHGDFCLSNVLYDRRHGLVRLIDPRGAFGEYGIFGDPRYDIAKLSHSLSGDYDFLVNELFTSSVSETTGFWFRAFVQKRHQAVKVTFEKWLDSRYSSHRQALRLLESLLFLTMVPLHSDRLRCQQVFLAQGLLQISGIVKSTKRSNAVV